MDVRFAIYFLFIIFCSQIAWGDQDRPCMRKTANDSYICVCNSTYCDEITRETPIKGQYFAYTTSKDGSRFRKTSAYLRKLNTTPIGGVPVLTLNPSRRYQYIEGYGGAVTDSAGINYAKLCDARLKEKFIQSYFGPKGIEYNMMRVPIGGCDFSTRQYEYNSLPENDINLTNYSLAYEDYNYKIPMILDAFNVATAPIHIVASTWSPPLWMKNPSKISGLNRLKKEYFQTYADYHLKFIEKYAENGIPIWAVTTTNEPLSGIMSLGHNNRLGWSTKSMGNWIAKNLGPTLRNSKFDVKILGCDDQRFTVPLWFNVVIKEVPAALEYMDGIAVHSYFDDINPPDILSTAVKDHPDKFLIYTESCTGVGETPHVVLGSWKRAIQYIENIIEDLNYNVTGWVDWNLVLDEQGGPNYIKNYVDSPIIVFPDRGEFIKQPLYYAMGHFSKFMPRGSQRIHVTQTNSPTSVAYVSVITPANNIVTVLYNKENTQRQVKLTIREQEAIVTLGPNSVVTLEFPNQ